MLRKFEACFRTRDLQCKFVKLTVLTKDSDDARSMHYWVPFVRRSYPVVALFGECGMPAPTVITLATEEACISWLTLPMLIKHLVGGGGNLAVVTLAELDVIDDEYDCKTAVIASVKEAETVLSFVPVFDAVGLDDGVEFEAGFNALAPKAHEADRDAHPMDEDSETQDDKEDFRDYDDDIRLDVKAIARLLGRRRGRLRPKGKPKGKAKGMAKRRTGPETALARRRLRRKMPDPGGGAVAVAAAEPVAAPELEPPAAAGAASIDATGVPAGAGR